MVEFDLGIPGGHLAGDFQEKAASSAQDVGLMDGSHLAPVVAHGVLEGGPHNALAPLAGNAAQGESGVGRDARHGSFVGKRLRHAREFDPDIHAFGVLAENRQVDALAVIERVSGEGHGGPQADVEIQQLAHADDGAAVDQAAALEVRRQLALGLRRRFGSDGAEEGAIGGAQQLDRPLGESFALLSPELPADISGQILGLKPGGIENQPGGIANFRTDAVSRQPGDSMHRKAPCLARRGGGQ